MTGKEHAARAMLLSGPWGGNLWYDAATNAYRPRSPEGSNYKYSGCLDAGTLEPLDKGEALMREGEAGIGNTVSSKRLGIPYARKANR